MYPFWLHFDTYTTHTCVQYIHTIQLTLLSNAQNDQYVCVFVCDVISDTEPLPLDFPSPSLWLAKHTLNN